MKLLFTGDVMLGRLVNEFLKNKPADYPWGDTLPIFENADFRACNLECVISDKGIPWSMPPKIFHFRSDAKNVAVLKAAGINAVSLANNHALDFEYEAMFDMLKILKMSGIKHAGAGSNLEEASECSVIEIKQRKIGFIAFTDNEPDWEARVNHPGIFYVPVDFKNGRSKNLFKLVARAKEKVELLIVSAHWGPNWGYEPPQSHIAFGHALIDAGADLVFGHSGHVARGVEIYKGKIIIYCAGNFIDDYAVDEIERNDQSFIFVIEFDNKRAIEAFLYPTIIRNFRANLAMGWEAESIALLMKELCAKFGTSSQWHRENNYLKLDIV